MKTERGHKRHLIHLVFALGLALGFFILGAGETARLFPTPAAAQPVPTPTGEANSALILSRLLQTGGSIRGYHPAWENDSPRLCDAATPAPIFDPSRIAVLVGAGDIATCPKDPAAATSKLLDAIDGTVVTLGDNVQGSGTPAEYSDCYDPTWGRHKDRTRPVPGNHDYLTDNASAYYTYFGAAAGDPAKGYYSYDLGDWHIVALNSLLDVSAESEQMRWLDADLAAHPSTCTLAYWHHPLFSSGTRPGGNGGMRDLWQVLYKYGVDIVLNGHEHIYERFLPQSPDGDVQPMRGIREFIVGTGGAQVDDPINVQLANSVVARNYTYGVLKLTLYPSSYDWEFISVPHQDFTDSGVAACVPSVMPPPLKYHVWLPSVLNME